MVEDHRPPAMGLLATMFVVLAAFTPRMLVPPPVMFTIVITFLVAFVISTIVFHDAARGEHGQRHEQAADCKSNAHGLFLL
jgi:hypothetical protein